MCDIVEYFISSKKANQEQCEDALILTSRYIGVADGASGSGEIFIGSKTCGKWISEAISVAFSALSLDEPIPDVLEYINDYICGMYRNESIYDFLESSVMGRPCATMAFCDLANREVVMVGDCQCIVNGRLYVTEGRLEKVLAEIRSVINANLLTSGYALNHIIERDLGREYIMPILQNRKIFQNATVKSEFVYYAVDGFAVPPEGVIKIKINEGPGDVVLATDGYPKIYNTLDQSEKYLADLLTEEKYKSTKGLSVGGNSFDDRAYVKIHFKS